jgi:hypothetical protein
MNMLLRAVSFLILVLILNIPMAQTSHAATPNQPISDAY